ncbi:MAG TPA: VOC family protein [Caldilineaceae bacterium]|nr:VOC family protein [Caldilineaceae bacterium]
MNIRLQHISVPRPPGSDSVARHFYGELLGLEEMTPPKALADLHVIWYRLGGETELHLLTEAPTGQDHSGRHFCLAVDDVEALRERLEAGGVAVVGDIPIPGRPRYFCRDPFGNLIEITTVEVDFRSLE